MAAERSVSSASAPGELTAGTTEAEHAGATDRALETKELSHFSYDPERMPVGTVFFYEKSNIDGSHSSTIATYVASLNRLESLKWTPGSDRSTLVAAVMDWDTYSVREFRTWHIFAGSRREPRMSAVADNARRTLVLESPNGPVDVPIVLFPWHNYDFDFASLALAMRHLRDPERPFTVAIIDRMVVDGAPGFGHRGTIEVRYEGDEERHGYTCRRYDVDGPGLENRGGDMWFDRDAGHLVDYEIDLPDEPGYESGKLRLLRTEPFTPERWRELVDASVSTDGTEGE